MSGVNKVIIVGRLGADPELRTTSGGQAVCTLRVATSENWMDKQGQKQERTEWHRVIIWGKQGENAGKYLAKGRQLYVEGRLQTRSWEAPDGQKRYTTEIVATTVQYLGGGNASAGGERSNDYSQNNNSANDFGAEPFFDASEEIPF